VRPPAAKLTDPDGGAGYLQLIADLTNRPRPALEQTLLDSRSDSIQRWRALVEPLLPTGATELHHRFTAMQMTITELARRARLHPRRDDELFISNLIDLVASVLAATVSTETQRLLERRTATRGERRASNVDRTGSAYKQVR